MMTHVPRGPAGGVLGGHLYTEDNLFELILGGYLPMKRFDRAVKEKAQP